MRSQRVSTISSVFEVKLFEKMSTNISSSFKGLVGGVYVLIFLSTHVYVNVDVIFVLVYN